MLAVVCGDNQEGNHMTNAVGSSVRISARYKEIRENLKEAFDCIVGTVMANKIAVMVPCRDMNEDYNERIELINKAREVARTLRKRTDIFFRIGIGGVKELENMNESYQEALKALVVTTGSVAHVDDLPLACEYEEHYPVNLENNLFANLEKGSRQQQQ